MRIRILLASVALFGLCRAGAAANQTVNIGPATTFSPAVVNVAPGDTVTWTWLASFHSTTSDATSGPEVWNSGVLTQGATFAHTFTTPGTYPYYCTIHGAPGGIGMSGQVIVAPPPSPTPTLTPGPPPVTPSPNSPASIPDLGVPGRLGLAFALAGAAVLLLLLSRRR